MKWSALHLAINFSAVPDVEYQNKQAIILDFANESVIPNAISPKFPKAGSLQRLAKAARIF